MLPGKFSLHQPLPWAITSGGLQSLQARLMREVMGADFNSRAPEMSALSVMLDERMGLREYQESGIAVQPVEGVIAYGIDPVEEYRYGMFNLQRLDDAIEQVADEPEAKAFVLAINSPGGSVQGLDETAKRLEELKTARPDLKTAAYITDVGGSAAYYLAAATDEIHASPAAIVGSIGCRCTMYDWSGMGKKIGVQVKDFKMGLLKSLGTFMKPWDKGEEKHMQNMVEYFGTNFRDFVSRRRPGITDAEMQGQAFYGAQASTGPGMMLDGREHRTLDRFLSALAAELR